MQIKKEKLSQGDVDNFNSQYPCERHSSEIGD